MLIKFSRPNFQNLFEQLVLQFTEYTVYSVILKNLAQNTITLQEINNC